MLETAVEIVAHILPSPFIDINRFFNEVAKEVENLKRHVREHFARQGGSARKADALTLLIEKKVQNNPDVSFLAVWKELSRLRDIRDIVQDIDDDEILFLNLHGRKKPLKFRG